MLYHEINNFYMRHFEEKFVNQKQSTMHIIIIIRCSYNNYEKNNVFNDKHHGKLMFLNTNIKKKYFFLY